MTNPTANEPFAEGKTKRILPSKTPGRVIVESKNDLTAGDGAKHDVIEGKGELSTRTTSNVFRLLKACGVPVAFIERIDDTCFLTEQCDMIDLEVIVRREAHGSFLKRRPELSKGHVFPRLLLEFFLKTSGKHWNGHDLPVDDPFMRIGAESAPLFMPKESIHQQEPFLELTDFPLKGRKELLSRIGDIAREVFLILEKAWQLLGRRLVDFKLEFGFNPDGELRLADVIDNDSWRVLENGQYIDKQGYRDGENLDTVTEKYRHVAALTDRFDLPNQRVILWRASSSDDLTPLRQALEKYGASENVCGILEVTCSLHKEPVRAYQELARMFQEIPDSVVLVLVGRSNGAGPTLSAHSSVPVISVPAGWRDFPDDVWSSLRTPSDAPAGTILDPKNAVLHALQILAMRNPALYARIRSKQEPRLRNMVSL